jgi:Family of unknown function (DUF6082)
MVLERPDLYGPVMGFSAPAGIEARQYLFATMLINYARMGYITGTIPEEDLRAETFREVFQGEPMRIWWAHTKGLWINSPGLDRRDRRFARIIEDEYRKAIAEGPPIIPSRQEFSSQVSTQEARKSWGVVAGLVLGIVIAIIFRSRRLNERR